MEYTEFIVKFAPYYVPFIAAIIIIIFTKNYLFRDMVDSTMFQKQIEREREIAKAIADNSHQLEEICHHLENLTKKVSAEIGESSEEMKGLQVQISKLVETIRVLAYNCEMHRKQVPDTEVFLQNRRGR